MKNLQNSFLIVTVFLFIFLNYTACVPKLCSAYQSNYLVPAYDSPFQKAHTKQDEVFFSYLSQEDSMPREDEFFKSNSLKYNGLVKKRKNIVGVVFKNYSHLQGNKPKIIRANPRYPILTASNDTLADDSISIVLSDEELLELIIKEQYPTVFSKEEKQNDSLLILPQKNIEQAFYEIKYTDQLTSFLDLKYQQDEEKLEENEEELEENSEENILEKQKSGFFSKLFKKKRKKKRKREEQIQEEDEILLDDNLED